MSQGNRCQELLFASDGKSPGGVPESFLAFNYTSKELLREFWRLDVKGIEQRRCPYSPGVQR